MVSYELAYESRYGSLDKVKELMSQLSSMTESERYDRLNNGQRQYGYSSDRTLYYMPALLEAIKSRNWAIAEYLIDCGADVNKLHEKSTPIGLAMDAGYIPMIRYLIEHGATVNDDCIKWITSKGHWSVLKNSILVSIAGKNDTKKLQELIEAGADPDEGDSKGKTPLMEAVSKNDALMLEYLISQCKVNINQKNHAGDTALMFAVSNNYLPMVKLLINKKADPTLQNISGKNALMLAIEQNHHLIVRHLVEECKLDINQKTLSGKIPLIVAVEGKSSQAAQYLIETAKADVNLSDSDGNTPLSCAIRNGDLILVRYLVEHGADVNKILKDGNTVLTWSVLNRHQDLAKFLVTNLKADANLSDSKGNTPLSCAIRNDDLILVRYLVEHGADVNLNMKSDDNILTRAIKKDDHELVLCLLKRGVDTNSFDIYGNTPLLQAAINGNLAIVKYLIEVGKVDIYQTNAVGDTALLSAAGNGHLPILRYLIEEKGCTLEMRNNQKRWAYGKGKSVFGKAREYCEKEPTKGQVIVSYLDTMKAKRGSGSTVNNSPTSSVSSVYTSNTFSASSASSGSSSKTASSSAVSQSSIPAISTSMTIEYDSLKIERKLGEGAFGTVHYAQRGHEFVAVKQLKLQSLDVKGVEEFTSEARIMEGLRSQYIIGLRGICVRPYCLVMEYAAGGSLYNLLHSQQELGWPQRIDIAVGIGKGLAFLHMQNPQILHRDLKSMNVLLTQHQEVKLTDFGLAKIKADTSAKTTSAAGTPAWMAPELLGGGSHTVEADIYSYAIVLWELAMRQMPFVGLNAMQIMFGASQGKRPEFPENSSSAQYRSMVFAAWDQQAERRPKLNALIENLEMQNKSSTADSIGFLPPASGVNQYPQRK